jgi:hypothetical protein
MVNLTYNYFSTVFEKNIKNIKKHGQFKFNLSNDDAEEITNQVYLQIANTFINNPNKNYDLNNEKKMLNYIYYSFASYCKSRNKTNRIETEDIEEHQNIDCEYSYKSELEEEGKSIFFDKVFEYLNKKVNQNEIKEIQLSIFKYYLYNKMTVIQISNQTGIKRNVIDYSIAKISNLLRDDETVQKLSNHYLKDIETL